MAMAQRDYGRVVEAIPVPDLMDIQIAANARFLQLDTPPDEREPQGLEAVLRETFPIQSYDGKYTLEYLGYDLGRPRYEELECKRLRLTYGMPFKIRVRLIGRGEGVIEEDVYLGEIPKMIGGGEFIINGAERVIVSQLHRSPGIDFDEEIRREKRLHKCRIIPERGSWIELQVTQKDVVTVRIDQSGKFPATGLLRAMDEQFGTDADLIRLFYSTEKVSLSSKTAQAKIKNCRVVDDVVDPKTGEILIEGGEEIPAEYAKVIAEAGIVSVEIITKVDDPLLLNTILEDPMKSHEEALIKIYMRLRPGNPAQAEKAKELFRDKFRDETRYRLGRVGRFRINRKFDQDVPLDRMTLSAEDFISCLRYLVKLRAGTAATDDIDHLGNRRVRTMDELAGEEFRKGFLKLKRTVQERMSMMDPERMTPRSLVNSKTVSSSIEYFFGRGELSQVVDQTNPLSQLTHERRLSALGPGGLNRKRAGFEVRDVHISHYGRICPIETPEGTNIGLIASLGIYASIDEFGFLITPYQVVKNGKLTGEIRYLRADEEAGKVIAPADCPVEGQKLVGDQVLARRDGDFLQVAPKAVEYIDISPKQLVGVSASLIPFLEHDDANRALMGSNMQRQAVPLIRTEPPIVATGMEKDVARNSGMVVRAKKAGTVTKADALEIIIDDGEPIPLKKFKKLNEGTCQNQRPIVRKGNRVKADEVIADGAGTCRGELSLGKNVLAAFMSWDGYNFEDAILVSESLVRDDRFTSVHIEEFEIEIRETKLGKEEFTRDIPNVSEKALSNLDETGIIRVGTRVRPGDILVGKVVPKSKTELSPEEKLLHAIFGRMGEDVKNDSLEVPPGVEGVVIETQHFQRKTYVTDEEKAAAEAEVARIEAKAKAEIEKSVTRLYKDLEEEIGKITVDGKPLSLPDAKAIPVRDLKSVLLPRRLGIKKKPDRLKTWKIINERFEAIEKKDIERDQEANKCRRGHELPPGVLEMVKVLVATKRILSVGDKMAGRHGNKGVIAKILPIEEMPFLEDGTPIEIVLNPLGVPSRMNVGQILETHLGWAARKMDFQAITRVFDGAPEEAAKKSLSDAKLPPDGKVKLYDGRTGEGFDQEVTVGYIYMMKLHHLVDDKIHARATGPYSLITQQPLGGKARFGGQRFGEMEVWALEAYGAANILQELLTVKSDDVDGRTKIYESMVKGENILEPGTPVSFDVLTNEIKGLGLNMELEKRRV